MKIIVNFLLFIISSGAINAQIVKVSSGSGLTILAGTPFTIGKLTITPSADFTINDLIISKSSTAIHTTANPYISRVYQFSNLSNPFSGSIQFGYTDGDELNGIAENLLTLNIHNGTGWSSHPAGSRDGTNNFVLTNSLAGIALSELTLASQLLSLPVTWLTFNTTKQNSGAKLEWTTVFEQNSRYFFVQHSNNGVTWTNIALIPAAGNSSGNRYYQYIHQDPVKGVNFYRIMQTDLDNSSNYSPVRTLMFDEKQQPFIVLGNPVSNGFLVLQIFMPCNMAMYSTDGRLLWKRFMNSGIEHIDVSRYSGGTYFLNVNNVTRKIILR